MQKFTENTITTIESLVKELEIIKKNGYAVDNEEFEKDVRGCPVPVVMAGGPQVDTELEVFQFVYDGMQKGAIGVNLGRNIWQNDFPVAMIKAIRAIVHENTSPEEAQEIYESNK